MEEKKCLHVPCTCTVKPDEEYCSGECQRADLEAGALGRGDGHCHCHHPDCEGIPLPVASAAESFPLPPEALMPG